MGKINIVFQAIPFCFGPGAQTLAIAHQLRSFLGTRLNLIALGSGTTLELLKMSKSFDKVYEYSTSDPFIPEKVRLVLLSADKVVCIGDFDFIERAYALGCKVEFVDPLFWMWNKFPANMDDCNHYYAVDFPGVKERVDEYIARFPDRLEPIIVNQICEYVHPLKNKKNTSRIIIVQFGGIQNPTGINIDLVVAMIEEISEGVRNLSHFKKILVRGGSLAMNIVRNKVGRLDQRVKIETSDHESFLNELSSCELLLTIPGMSVVYEAFASKVPLLFLLPLNYSQHRQLVAYKKIFEDFKCIVWEDFPGYHTLPERIPEAQAIRKAIKLGTHFSADTEARLRFREKIIDFLTHEQRKPLREKSHKIAGKEIKINGAQEIAIDLINDFLR